MSVLAKNRNLFASRSGFRVSKLASSKRLSVLDAWWTFFVDCEFILIFEGNSNLKSENLRLKLILVKKFGRIAVCEVGEVVNFVFESTFQTIHSYLADCIVLCLFWPENNAQRLCSRTPHFSKSANKWAFVFFIELLESFLLKFLFSSLWIIAIVYKIKHFAVAEKKNVLLRNLDVLLLFGRSLFNWFDDLCLYGVCFWS